MCAPPSSPRRNKLVALEVIIWEHLVQYLWESDRHLWLCIHHTITHELVSKITCHMSAFFRARRLLPVHIVNRAMWPASLVSNSLPNKTFSPPFSSWGAFALGFDEIKTLPSRFGYGPGH